MTSHRIPFIAAWFTKNIIDVYRTLTNRPTANIKPRITHGSIINVFFYNKTIFLPFRFRFIQLITSNETASSEWHLKNWIWFTIFVELMEKRFYLDSANYEQRRDQNCHAQVYREDDFYDALVQHVDQYRLPFDVQSKDHNQRDDR